jgi:phosphopantothenoylcysteine decarboxylase/phosphopantothenate--cysteine ligase
MTNSNRKIILGVSGGIAAYKTAELIRLFKKAGDEVQVAMTEDAARFVTPLTLATLSERPVLTSIFTDQLDGSWTKHVELGLWADLVVVAPATANTIAKMAHGRCDSMLLAVALSARCPVLICPAMDHDMFQHPVTQKNLVSLERFGYHVFPPEHGELASGLIGWGRLPEPETIASRVDEILAETKPDNDLEGKSVLVTAGPTREKVDPIRFLSNHSTGTMGFALASAAAQRGARVTLVSGPSTLDTPRTVDRIDVVSAADMTQAVLDNATADIVIMAAAVADYRPAHPAESKIKKSGQSLTLDLERTTDILATLGASKTPGQILIGFAMETEDGEQNARKKLKEKNLDWIVLNNLRDAGAGFGPDTNRVTLIGADDSTESFPVQSKSGLAHKLVARFAQASIDA